MRAGLCAALLAALQLLTGGAEIIIQTWLFIGVIALFRAGTGKVGWLKVSAGSVLIVIFAGALAAAQIFPFLELLEHSQRSGQASGGAGAVGALPVVGWMNYLVPLFRFVETPSGVFAQIGQSWTGSYYIGIGVISAALLACFGARDIRALALGALAILAILLAMGSKAYLYDWLAAALPVVGHVRFPVKFVFSANFAILCMAAIGWAWLEKGGTLRPVQPRKALAVGAGLAACMAGIAVYNSLFPIPGVPVSPGNWSALRAMAFLGAFVALTIAISGRWPRWGARARILTMLLLWADVLTHAPDLAPTVPAGILAPGQAREFFDWGNELRPGTTRAMLSPEALLKLLSSSKADLPLDTTARRLALLMNYNLLDNAAKVDGFYSMDLAAYLEVFKHLYFTTNSMDGLRRFLAISHVSNPSNILDWVQRSNHLSMVTAGQKPVFAAPADALRALLGESFDPAAVVLLPLAAADRIQAKQNNRCIISDLHFFNHALRFRTQAAEPSMVVISQAYYPYWAASVDGEPVAMWKANYAFQAIEVPSGDHHVLLRFESRSFTLGLAVSGVALALWALLWLATDHAFQRAVTGWRWLRGRSKA